MSFPVFETAQAFSDTTCRTLSGLLIRSGALAPAGPFPADFVQTLRRLAAEDEAFATWCRTIIAHRFDSSSKTSPPLEGADPPIDWQYIAAELPQLIVRSLAMHGPHRSPSDPSDAPCQLVELSHLLIRQRSLEANFAAELRRQKTEAIYHFAYGLSHELNNPLANIATRASVLAREESSTARRQMLENIISNAMRGSEMLADLMLVARPPLLQIAPLTFSDLLSQVILQAQPWAELRDVTLQSHNNCVEDLQIACDRAAMRECLWAIIRNAIEALPDGGEVSILAHVETEMVIIRVIDPGPGLTPLALEHGFDPYFSGREAGRGLGLGLSKAKRIIDLHQGHLSIGNRAGGGCEVTLCLPISATNSVESGVIESRFVESQPLESTSPVPQPTT